ncbi:MAG: isoprenylcysteine carboxylmethyltransferase family protein [Anaerolineales bacterium]|uniref:methyltransferase family protein n=1 Tax=Candidatus Villigracilis proximus TaxID=3140683 RepID=UPI0031376A4D|nr:isoprenylcysteine carboxylmethyltransferase family protein [Anaerolineales bacterium]
MAEKQMDHPNINKNIHPPFVALFYIFIALVLGRVIVTPFVMPQIARNIGLALTFIGFLFGVGAFIEFRKARTTLDPHGSVKTLVMNGIYRITRNPIYFGFLLMVIGFPLNYGHFWGFLTAPFYIVSMNQLVIEKEEAYLEKKFKEQYTAYRLRVRRWL